MPKSVRLVLVCVATLAIFISQPRDAGAVAMTPGSYVVSMKWEQSGQVFVRLAMYSFRPDYTFRADYWEWNSGQGDTVVSQQRVGYTQGQRTTDTNARVMGSSRFVGASTNLTTRFGTWAPFQNRNIKITWSNGTVEWWKRTWHDATINKIELIYIGYATYPNDTHMYWISQPGYWTRRDFAPNGGFGLGGATPGFTFAQPMSAFLNGYFDGWSLKWNYYCIQDSLACEDNQGPYQIDRNGSDLSDMTVTTTGILRQFVPSDDPMQYCDGHEDAYYYAAIPLGSTGMTARRLLFQNSHDFCSVTNPQIKNNNGRIDDEYGHLQYSLQAIDSNYAMRGWVTVEASHEPLGAMMMMMAAMFAIDNTSSQASIGIEDLTKW